MTRGLATVRAGLGADLGLGLATATGLRTTCRTTGLGTTTGAGFSTTARGGSVTVGLTVVAGGSTFSAPTIAVGRAPQTTLRLRSTRGTHVVLPPKPART
ncbi:hypothetical protein ATO5_07915 [Loktanella sp. 22II-4b]|nr:hypothetical protein ATO5_07915 [Loktanella sp. 22II-4b]